MRLSVWRRSLGLVLLASATLSAGARGQASAIEQRGPRFLIAPTVTAKAEPLDVARMPVLRQQVALDLSHATLDDALVRVTELTGLAFVYSRDLLAHAGHVSLSARRITVAAALTEILLDAGVDVLMLSAKQAALVRRVERRVSASGSIVGRVTDAKTGESIVGADVLVEGTPLRVASGDKGYFRIADVEAGARAVVVRRVGYAKQRRDVTVVVGQEVTLDVALTPVVTQLNEIVTTVTGDQRRVELGHVVGVINADSVVREAPVSTLSELLNGRVPGLQVFQNQGTVGGEVRLQIRGANSLKLRIDPIIVVDGVRYTSGKAPRAWIYNSGPADVEPTSPLNDINPNDIESIEVVKGPSAATLYGTDAANGVLVITTKRGRPGPARWNAYAKTTRTAIPSQRFPDFYWGWGTVNGVPDDSTTNCTLRGLAEGWCTQQDSVTVIENPLNDPRYTIFGSTPSWEYGANVSGGRQDLRYYFGGDAASAVGPVQMPPAIIEQLKEQRGLHDVPEEWREPNTLSKLALRANVAAMLGDVADLRVNTGYVHSATRSLAADRSPYSGGVFYGGPTGPYGNNSGSPAQVFVQTSTARTDRVFGSGNGQWRPLSWVTLRGTVGLDLTGRNQYSLARRGDAPGDYFAADGMVQDERARQLATTAEFGATAMLRRGRLSARTAVGAQYVRNLSDVLGSIGSDLPPGGTSVGEAINMQTTQAYAETVTLGSYVEETLGLNDRLFLTGALRLDGASAFGQDYNAAAYPKVSLSWLVSEEPFLPRLPGLDELRLRYALGVSGQQPTAAMGRPFFFSDKSVQNGVATAAVRLFGLGNPDLRPERVREYEFGFDAAAFANRVQLGLTWYSRRSKDQISSTRLPPGFQSMYTNIGLTRQHGFELELTAHILDRPALSWDVILQHSLHRTKLIDIGRGFPLPDPEGGYVEGYPLGARFQRPVLGYSDSNGDGVIAESEQRLGPTAVYAGESTPPQSQTLTMMVGLFERRLRMSGLLERRSGFTQINTLACSGDLCRPRVDLATPLDEQARALNVLGVGVPERADFIRLREVSAAFDLPVRITRALRARSATVVLAVRNLGLWTDFSGADPESAAANAALPPISGGSASGIPQGRSWMLRLDLGL